MLRDDPPSAIVLDLDLVTFDPFELLRAHRRRPRRCAARPCSCSRSDGDFATFEHAHRARRRPSSSPSRSRRTSCGAKLDALVSGRKQRADGRLKLGALLVASGLVTQEQLDGALARQNDGGGRLGEVLVAEGLVSEQDIVTAVAGQMRIGVVDLTQTTPQPAALGLLPRDFIVRRRLMPLSLDDNGSLVLAMTNPLDVISIDEVGMRTKKRVVPVICTESGFDEAVAIYFSSRGKLKDARDDGGRAGDAAPATSTPTSSRSSTRLLTDAASMDASDIHLEPREDSLQRALPHRRRAARHARVPQGAAGRHHQPPQDHGQPQHRRAAPAAGRPHQLRALERRGRRPAPRLHPQHVRREPHHPHPRGLAAAAHARLARPRRRQPRALRGGAQGARRAASSSSAPPARASPPRSTPRSSSSSRRSARSTRSRTPSSARSRASSRPRSSRPSASPSPRRCARSCAPTRT